MIARMRLIVSAAVLVTAACGPKSGGGDEPNACERYLDCLAATDQDAFEDELELYGSNGSCFENSSAETCYEACEQKRDDLVEDDEACADPPETTTDVPTDPPDVDENGQVDCAELPANGPTVAGGEIGALAFPEHGCSPRASGQGEYMCCSDDPSALGGALPAYRGKGIDGATPIFADANNGMSTRGMCVRTDDIPPGSGLLDAPNCPIPCDPTWTNEDVGAVCGTSRVCCQTLELQPADCVLDPATMEWRPARGTDVIAGISNWATAMHATHQDPSGLSCTEIAGGDQSGAIFEDCVSQLRVASQRGYCLALQPGQACPETIPSYIDACESINMGLTPPPR